MVKVLELFDHPALTWWKRTLFKSSLSQQRNSWIGNPTCWVRVSTPCDHLPLGTSHIKGEEWWSSLLGIDYRVWGWNANGFSQGWMLRSSKTKTAVIMFWWCRSQPSLMKPFDNNVSMLLHGSSFTSPPLHPSVLEDENGISFENCRSYCSATASESWGRIKCLLTFHTRGCHFPSQFQRWKIKYEISRALKTVSMQLFYVVKRMECWVQFSPAGV